MSLLLVVFAVSLFLMLPLSDFIYVHLPFFSFIQYPWRFLNFVLFSVSLMPFIFFAQPPSFNFLKSRHFKLLVTATLCPVIVLIYAKYFSPQTIIPFNTGNYLSRNNLLFRISKISDEYLPADLTVPAGPEDLPSQLLNGENLDIQVIDNEVIHKQFRLTVPFKQNVTASTAYFPGWFVFLDNQPLPITEKQGLISFNLPSGRHLLEMKFTDTPVRTIANFISLLTFILILYLTLLPQNFNLWLKSILSR